MITTIERFASLRRAVLAGDLRGAIGTTQAPSGDWADIGSQPFQVRQTGAGEIPVNWVVARIPTDHWTVPEPADSYLVMVSTERYGVLDCMVAPAPRGGICASLFERFNTRMDLSYNGEENP